MDHRPGGKKGGPPVGRGGPFRVTILGSGTCVPDPLRSSCSLLMELAGKRMVFDTGPGTLLRLTEAGVGIHDIDIVCYSHFHPDHTGELAAFLFANKYPTPTRRSKPLLMVGGSGFLRFLEGIKAVYGKWIDLGPGIFRALEMNSAGYDSRSFDAIRLETLPMAHNPESVGYRITGPAGRSAVYSGDTDVCDNLVTLAKNADLLVCESATPDRLKVPGHLTPSEAGRLAARAGVAKLVLTHFYPECRSADMAGECRKTYGGPLALAEDLMRLDLN